MLSQTPQQLAVQRASQPLAATLRPAAAGLATSIAETAPAARVRPVMPGDAGKMAAASAMLPLAPATSPLPREAPQEALRTAPMTNTANKAATMASAAVAEGKITVGAGLDADGVRQYRVNLASAARRFKRYPAQALEKGWSGSAEVELAIAASGVAQPPRLMSSSGHELLDEAALTMIGRAAQATLVPASLSGRAFAVKLPIMFDLDE